MCLSVCACERTQGGLCAKGSSHITSWRFPCFCWWVKTMLKPPDTYTCCHCDTSKISKRGFLFLFFSTMRTHTEMCYWSKVSQEMSYCIYCWGLWKHTFHCYCSDLLGGKNGDLKKMFHRVEVQTCLLWVKNNLVSFTQCTQGATCRFVAEVIHCHPVDKRCRSKGQERKQDGEEKHAYNNK